MMTPPSRYRMTERERETPLRLNIAPGVIAAHASQTIVILEPLHGSEIRVRDMATGTEKIVPVCELSGAALGLSRKDTQRRLESLRGVTRGEWLRARRRERVIMRLIRSDGEIAKQVTRASRALGLSRSSIYRLLRQYRQAAQTSSLLIGHRGTPKQHRRLSDRREALVTRAIEEKYLARPRMTISGLKEEIRIRCLRASLKPVSRKAIEMRIARLDPRLSLRQCPLRLDWLSLANRLPTPSSWICHTAWDLSQTHPFFKLVRAISQTMPPHRSTSITEASTLRSVALELILSIGILPRGLHRLSFPSIAKDQSSRVPQNSL